MNGVNAVHNQWTPASNTFCRMCAKYETSLQMLTVKYKGNDSYIASNVYWFGYMIGT